MGTYRVLRRPLRVDGVLHDPGSTFTADLPREESWERAGLIEVIPEPEPEKPKKRRKRTVRKAAAQPEPAGDEQVD